MKIRFSTLFFLLLTPLLQAESYFQSAKPIWPSGMEKEMNLTAGFRAVFDTDGHSRTLLRLTASSLYRVYVNGEFAGYGPARGPHGYFRVDEWDLSGKIRSGRNLVAIEAVGYNTDSYYLLNQPSFLQAEVVSGGQVLASTAGEGVRFEALLPKERLRKVERYSIQRTFAEAYWLRPHYDDWLRDSGARVSAVSCSTVAGGKLLPRRVPYPHFVVRQPASLVATGSIRAGVAPQQIWKSRARSQPEEYRGFPEREYEADASLDLQRIATVKGDRVDRPLLGPAALVLGPDSYRIVDFGTNLTGFLGINLTCSRRTKLYLAFDELLTAGDVNFKRLGVVNAVPLEFEAGSYAFETIEPYTMRYLKVIVTDGECRTEEIHLREYVNPNVWQAHFASSDERLNRLFAAGRETFRQNAVDIFTDCPSRERAGWLCDSYFTARVAPDLGGDTVVEKNFFENYLLPESFPVVPKCMLPMCYPADHPSGRFIPNWAMWFVLELEEYLGRSGDRRMVDSLEPKVLRLFDYFKQFQNKDGLLEKLPSWVFIEWSKANQFVQDVNYPSNMLYAAALAAAGRMYAEPELLAEAGKVREAIRRQSFDGEFFVDNAVRKNGKLEITRNRTEVCQYFAFYFETATRETYPGLWSVLRDQFGPGRAKAGKFPEIYPANAFVGNMLRLELLSRYGRVQQLLDESIAYLLYMADRTGTLWENITPTASCNHGFNSHIVHTLYRDVLGIRSVDPVRKKVRLRFSRLRLDWCEGTIPVEDGRVSLRWRKEGDRLTYQAEVPAGYSIEVENASGMKLAPRQSLPGVQPF